MDWGQMIVTLLFASIVGFAVFGEAKRVKRETSLQKKRRDVCG